MVNAYFVIIGNNMYSYKPENSVTSAKCPHIIRAVWNSGQWSEIMKLVITCKNNTLHVNLFCLSVIKYNQKRKNAMLIYRTGELVKSAVKN